MTVSIAPLTGARAAVMAVGLSLVFLGTPVQAVDTPPASDCVKIVADLEKYFHEIPTDFGSRAVADRLTARTEEALQNTKTFLDNCEKLPETTPTQTGVVLFVRAKALLLLSGVYRLQVYEQAKTDRAADIGYFVSRAMVAYQQQIHQLLRQARERLPAEHSFGVRALELLAFSLHQGRRDGKLGESMVVEAESVYHEFLDKHPNDKEVHRVIHGLSKLYLDLRQYQPGIVLLEKALKEQYASASFPFMVDTLRKLYIGAGDLDGFQKTVETGVFLFPLKSTNRKLAGNLKKAYERYMVYYGFWHAYGRMAKGDLEGAQTEFADHIKRLDAQASELQNKGEQLKPEFSIYRGRSATTLDFLNEVAEKPAPRELDLLWTTDSQILLSDSLGTVTGILFRGVDDKRSKEFMTELSLICEKEPDLQLAAVHFMRKQQNPELRTSQLRSELLELGYRGAAGFDPDAETQGIFRAYKVKVGSASFVVVDRDGNVRWFMEDPRPIDVGFAHSIMRRVGGN